MELIQAVRTRRSVRRYSAEVPLEKIDEMLALAAFAPSACNRRGWRCILVQGREDMDWLYLHGGSSVFQDSSQALLVCYEAQTENSQWNDNIQSAAAFIAYFQLIAHDRGIGSCWICHLPPKREVCKRFEIPQAYTPVAVVTLGEYQKEHSPQLRGDIETGFLFVNRWSLDVGGEEAFKTAYSLRRLMRKLYYALPFRGWLRGWAGRYEKRFDD